MRVSVLSGDIIASTSLSAEQQDAIMAALSEACATAGGWHGAPLHFTRQQGDGWQAILMHPQRALRTALYCQSAVRSLGKSVSTRISLADGDIDHLPEGDLNSATDAVFVRSGRLLDRLDRHEVMRHEAGGALGAATRLFDHISQGWTAAQARAIHPMLAPDPPRYSDIAQELGISRQAVGQALDGAGFGPIRDALEMIETDQAGN